MPSQPQNQSGLNRREFLVVSCGASLALVLRGGMAAASQEPAGQEFIQSTCGKGVKPAQKVLIAYASRCGSTGAIAQAMADALCGLGASVDVRLVKEVKDLKPYQAVMVGSAIRRGKWLSEATSFIKTNQDALSRIPVAYFVACLTMREDTPENRAKVLAYLDPVKKVAPRISPIAVGLFPGVVDFGKLSFMEETMLKARGIVEGDFRNLPAVKGWASDQSSRLFAAQTRG